MIAAAAFAAGVWAAVLVLAVGLCRAAGRSRRLDEQLEADRDAVLWATATVTPLDEGRRWRADG